MTLRDRVTVLMPSSPIPSHPSLEIIAESIHHIRAVPELEDVRVLVMLDGVREEQPERAEAYAAYKRGLTQVVGFPGGLFEHCTLVEFERHTHQANMTRRALDMVATPLVYFVEHDTFAKGDIPWSAIDGIMGEEVPVVRFHIFHRVLDEHANLYEPEREWIGGVPLLRTRQWSQRPHLATTEYYRRVIAEWFPADCRTMIEDRLVGPVTTSPWDRFKLRIYAPDGDMTRSFTNNGRGSDIKFPMYWSGAWR